MDFLNGNTEQFFSFVDEGVLMINESGMVIYSNEPLLKMLDLKKSKLIGKPLEHLLDVKYHDVLTKGETGLNRVLTINDKKETCSIFPIRDDDEIVGACVVFQLKKSDARLNEDYSSQVLDTILDTTNEWMVVVDAEGYITMMSKAYMAFNDVDDAIGRHVTEVIENTRMHLVVKTGVAEMGDIQYIRGNKMIASRIPIRKDGKVVGAVGKVIFKDISDFYSLSNKLQKLEDEVAFYKEELGKERMGKYSFEQIIGHSEKTDAVKRMALKASKTDSNVLIIGESGTGKEMYAHSIHNASKRRYGPFVKINCAAIPSELMEAELFGYEEGAFTGACKKGKKGKFELANKGTIFLDEIGDMSMEMQVKLLRVIQEREVDHIGGSKPVKIDVRIIAATNKNLEECIMHGTFREDLFYRLNVMRLKLYPLRERQDEVAEISQILLKKLSAKLGIHVNAISDEAMQLLKHYTWPGNVRELENVLERAINLLDEDYIIKAVHLPDRLIREKYVYKYDSQKERYLHEILEKVEKDIIEKTLNENGWNKNKTSRLLGISRAGLYNKIAQYHLEQKKG